MANECDEKTLKIIKAKEIFYQVRVEQKGGVRGNKQGGGEKRKGKKGRGERRKGREEGGERKGER